MSILNTPEANRWLGQFDEQDKETAELMLNTLQLISFDKFEAGIINLVREIQEKCSGPVALYCIRETDPRKPYFDKAPIDSAPLKVRPNDEVGSEGRVAHIISNLHRQNPSSYLSHSSLKDLRDKGCHNIILIDDLMGSGKRSEKFLRNFYDHTTLKSWYSYKKIDIHIACYASSDKALKKIKQVLRRPPSVHFREVSSSYQSRLSHEDFESVCDLCKKYGRLASERNVRLGYAKSMGTMVFAHGCPNNVPAILWKKSAHWTPLFDERHVPTQLMKRFGELDKSQRKLRQQVLFDKAGFSNYGRAFQSDPELRNMLLILSAAKNGARDVDRISEAIDLNLPETQRLLELCQKAELLTTGLRVTGKANHLIRKNRKKDVANSTGKGFDNSFYFPYGRL